MLFHVTMTHTEDNCPGYNKEMIPQVLEGLEQREEIAKRRGVKLHFLVNGAPEHTFFALLEADSLASVDLFLFEALPFKQAFQVRAVNPVEDLVRIAKEMAAQG